MRVWWLVALLAGIGLGACFSEEDGFTCNPGEGGCECNRGVCFEGLECTSGYCTRQGCESGTEFCVCDDGMCDGDLECFESIVCRPKKGKGDPTGVTGSESDGGGDASGSTTSSSSTGTSSTTQASADSGETGGDCDPACGECTTCNANGECVADPGVLCDGPALQCADYVHGLEDGTCYALGAAEMGAVCNSQGTCVSATAQDCDAVQGDVLATCEASCVKAAGLCTPFAPASAVELDAFCEQDGTTTECTTVCFNGSYSEVNFNVCSGGACIQTGDMDCGAYDCENAMSLTSCTSDIDCSMFHVCDLMTGMCFLP